MENKTAVEWLNAEFERLSNHIGVNLTWTIVDDLIKQAKEMEKNQIIQAVNEHDEKCVKTCNGVVKRLKPSVGSLFDYSGEEGVKYYNEKFENGRDSDVIWSAKHIDANVSLHVDAKNLDYKYKK